MSELELIFEIICYLIVIGLLLFMWKQFSDNGIALPY